MFLTWMTCNQREERKAKCKVCLFKRIQNRHRCKTQTTFKMKYLLLFCSAAVMFHCSCSSDSAAAWCYYEPSCNDTTWSTIATQFCNGTRQSPIDIVSSNLQPDSSLTGFNLTGFNSSALTKITNTGKTVEVTLSPGRMRLAGGGLPGEYVGVQVHLHWGNKASSPGSEHSVDGRRYPMELHIVNTKSIYNGNLSVAANDSEGLAALGFFIEATSETDKPDSWKTLTSYLPKIIEKSNFADISPNITVYDLISAVNISRYYRYLGSLTTPNCNEAVVWTVFKEPIKVSQNLIDLFSTTVHINDSSSQLIINNYRHVQALNSRVVKTQPSSNTGTRCLISLLSLGVMLIHASQTLGSL